MRAVLAALLAVAALSACGDDGPEFSTSSQPSPSPSSSFSSASPSPSPRPSPAPAPTRAAATDHDCTHAAEGYTVRFPADWHVAAEEGIEPCTFFHPEPLDLEPGGEAEGVAIRLDVMADPFPEARRKVEADGTTSAREETVRSRRAVRFEGETTDMGLLPPGLATTTWLVDMGSRTLLLTTDEGGTDDYRAAVAVLDDMARSVRVS